MSGWGRQMDQALDRWLTTDPREEGEERCEKCGEPDDGEMAEIWNPASPEGDNVICHASCIPEGWEIA